jgi:hypothetical protein
MRWWTTSARSDADGFAVPMSMPRYTCIASTETSSTSPNARAAAVATTDLPEAVGPTTATTCAGAASWSANWLDVQPEV